MVNVAILGFGTVGSGVFEVLERNHDRIFKNCGSHVHVKRILDLRAFEDASVCEKLTKNFDDILNDGDISVVVETMGGTNPAYGFVKACLENKKSVVTSNKELVEKHGTELLASAKANCVNFLFEASVGGGIPVISALRNSLCGDNITKIVGILNGTTNFMLTKMYEEQVGFDVALKEAQALGYAEANPTADVCGHDTGRKLAILLSIVTGKKARFEDIEIEGITEITANDIALAKEKNCTIKLVGFAKISDNGVFACVSPMLVKLGSPLAAINDVFNGVVLSGDCVDDVLFYGKGAGKIPTASAVVSDIVDCAKNGSETLWMPWCADVLDISEHKSDNGVSDFGDHILCKFSELAYADGLEMAKL